MHPLSVCEFDPLLIENINPYDTKDMMTQLCINKMKLSMPNPKEVFNDEDFVNKVRFLRTENSITLEACNKDIWTVLPKFKQRTFVMIPEMEKHIKGIYVCKSIFSGKTYVEHFIMFQDGLIPYMSFRVLYKEPYIDQVYNTVQSFISKNKFKEAEETSIVLHLLCERDALTFNENCPYLYKLLRISMEGMKRIAYVQSSN